MPSRNDRSGARSNGIHDDNDNGGSNTASGADGRGRKGRCHNYGVQGHFTRACWKLKKNKAQKEEALICDAGDMSGLY